MSLTLAPPPAKPLFRVVTVLHELRRADEALVADDLTEEDRAAARVRAAEALQAVYRLAYEVNADAIRDAVQRHVDAERRSVVEFLQSEGKRFLALSVECGVHRKKDRRGVTSFSATMAPVPSAPGGRIPVGTGARNAP